MTTPGGFARILTFAIPISAGCPYRIRLVNLWSRTLVSPLGGSESDPPSAAGEGLRRVTKCVTKMRARRWPLSRAIHHADAAADHEPAGWLLGNRNLEHGTGERERAADGQRFVGLPLRVPFLDVEVEAGEPVIALKWQ